MLKRTILFILMAILMLTLTLGAHAAMQQRSLAKKLIRLHVVANSDSEADQSMKLQVRDAILQTVAEATKDCQTQADAAACLQNQLAQLRKRAQQTLKALGSDYDVNVTLQNEAFPTRYYDTFALPAGDYLSLRVTIGAGAGHNWWCVVFPSLCTAATSEEWEHAAQTANFSSDESAFIEGEEKYVLKFKLLEWLHFVFR